MRAGGEFDGAGKTWLRTAFDCETDAGFGCRRMGAASSDPAFGMVEGIGEGLRRERPVNGRIAQQVGEIARIRFAKFAQPQGNRADEREAASFGRERAMNAGRERSGNIAFRALGAGGV